MQKQFRATRNAPRRLGWTLIEVMVMTTIGLSVAGMATVVLTKYLALNHGQTEQANESKELRRLARQLRDDAHAASQATVADDKKDDDAKLVLDISPNRRVTYLADEGAIERTISESGNDVAHDRFDISPRKTVHWRTPATGEAGQIAIVLDPLVTKEGAPLPPLVDQVALEIVARLGSDRRAIERESQ